MKRFSISMIVLFPLLILCYCCNSSFEKKIKSTSENNLILTKSNISLLQGAWGLDTNLNASFGIYRDSIYYPDPNLWYKYSISADTLIIYSDQNIEDEILVIKITTDSLILKYLRENEVMRYSKRK
jgi:hypothetical protein